MKVDLTCTAEERRYLRELARKQTEYAALPIMAQREALWYAHNSVQGERPVIVVEMDTFEHEMLPTPRCMSPAAEVLEQNLSRHLVNFEWIGDDKVVPEYYAVEWQIQVDEFGVEIPEEHADDGHGGAVGYRWQHPLRTLKEDFARLKPARFSVDREYTLAWQSFAEEVFDGILPVRIENNSLRWHVAPSCKVVALMGLQQMMLSLVDEPEEMPALYAYLRDNILAFAKWQETEGLLTLNNGNHFAGAGSYGFTCELPAESYARAGRVTTRDLWLNINSQETVSISPRMYRDVVFPVYADIAREFGLVYYGCCEPVHDIWECCVSRLPHLRKVSISAWCNEEFMGEALRGSRVIYSRKPSPLFLGVGVGFDEEGFAEHIRRTLAAAAGCGLEFIFRDVYTVSGDRTKPGRAVAITRQLINELW